MHTGLTTPSPSVVDRDVPRALSFMNRRQRERLDASFKLRHGLVERATLTEEEAHAHFFAIDEKDVIPFGIRRIMHVDVNRLYTPRPTGHLRGVPMDPEITLLAYAAWRRRDVIAKLLLRAGADPTIRHPCGSVLRPEDESVVRAAISRLGWAAQVFGAVQVVRMRLLSTREAASRPGGLGACSACGSSELAILCEPCEHVCCEPCIWAKMAAAAATEGGAFACPQCSVRLSSFVDKPADARCVPRLRPPQGRGWWCDGCVYHNNLRRTSCCNCGADRPAYVQVPTGPAPEALALRAPGAARELADERARAPLGARAGARAVAGAAVGTLGATAALVALGAARLGVGRARACAALGFGLGAATLAIAAARRAEAFAPPRAPRGTGPATTAAPASAADGGLADGGAEAAPAVVEVQLRLCRTRVLGSKLSFISGTVTELSCQACGTHLCARAEGRGAKAEPERAAASVATPETGACCEECAAFSPGQLAQVVLNECTAYPECDGTLVRQGCEKATSAAMAEGSSRPRPLVRVRGVRQPDPKRSSPSGLELRASSCELLEPKLAKQRLDAPRPKPAPRRSATESRRRRFVPQPALEDAVRRLRRAKLADRREALFTAAVKGDTLRLAALKEVGEDVGGARDAYGQTALHIAAAHGQLLAVHALLEQHGADANALAPSGATPVSAAAARGHGAVLDELVRAGADADRPGSEGVSPLGYALRRAAAASLLPLRAALGPAHGLACLAGAAAAAGGAEADGGDDTASDGTTCRDFSGVGDAEGEGERGERASAGASPPELRLCAAPVLAPPPPLTATLTRLIPSEAAHPGAGSCVIDGAFPDVFLSQLERLFSRLPLAPRTKETQGKNDRSYFCDAEGWVQRALREAVRACGADAPCAGEAMAHMRFLLYAEAGGGLPPHIDLARTDACGARSSHTFILYLTDCAAGGATELVEHMQCGTAKPPATLASVRPTRGRLLLFPHVCPHLAREVVAEGLPKLLLRGEIR